MPLIISGCEEPNRQVIANKRMVKTTTPQAIQRRGTRLLMAILSVRRRKERTADITATTIAVSNAAYISHSITSANR